MFHSLAALLCAFCLAATPQGSAWAAGQPLTQADLKPLAEDDFDAKVKALNALIEPCEVTLHTDSRYVIDGITKWVHGWQRNGWKNASKQPVRNADLWHELIAAARPHSIEWVWVKGHNGHAENERVDALACAEAEKIAKR